ncbi:phosphoribosylanthranilate isomerase [Parvibaculum sp.]|jgi:phosphoribosylanthranilate isomerase|uniref:phosphoribosylanthranilate isomerase n=1 Tax=Parvibaculum sp. TaxID=2024848 RepID=UPI003297842F
MSVRVKICGLSTPETVEAAVKAGADYLGFAFIPKSSRNISTGQARILAQGVPSSVLKVALTVDADEQTLDEIVEALKPDILQLHGAETPERLMELKARYGLPLMKAIGIAEPEDPLKAAIYRDSADLLLFDAKPPKSMAGALPGGNGLVFDWSLIAGHRPETPWMLSGGLNAENVAEAIRITGAQAVDVSSGVEDAPGRKIPGLIEAFIRAAKAA